MKILFASTKTTEYQLNNDVTITSFCFVNKSCLANSLFSNKMEHQCMLQVTQQWQHAAHCPDLIDKDSWPPNSMDMNLLDYHVWGSILLSPESAAEGHPGTEVSTCEDLGRVTTRHYLQVDREFQEASASLCNCRRRTFWAVTVTLLIDLTYAVFATLKAKRCSKMWSLTVY